MENSNHSIPDNVPKNLIIFITYHSSPDNKVEDFDEHYNEEQPVFLREYSKDGVFVHKDV